MNILQDILRIKISKLASHFNTISTVSNRHMFFKLLNRFNVNT